VLRARLKRRTVRIGATAVDLPAAGGARVAVKLSKPARRALTRGRLKATAKLTLRDEHGGSASAKAAVKLRPSRPAGLEVGLKPPASSIPPFTDIVRIRRNRAFPRRFVPLPLPSRS
jgi:hypothetical protein